MKKKQLQQELSKLAGRDLRLSFLTHGGIHAASFYMLMTSRVQPAIEKKIPVVFFDHADHFIQPVEDSKAGGLLKTLVRNDIGSAEKNFIGKLDKGGMGGVRDFPYLYSRREEIKKAIVSSVVARLLRWTGLSGMIDNPAYHKRSSESALRWLLGRVFTGKNFRSGGAEAREARLDASLISDPEKFEEIVEASFLPELLSFSKRYRLFFVLSNTNPALKKEKQYLSVLGPQLRDYLGRNGASGFVNLNERAELQAPDLMSDSRHFKGGAPRVLNTRVIAEELNALGILDK